MWRGAVVSMIAALLFSGVQSAWAEVACFPSSKVHQRNSFMTYTDSKEWSTFQASPGTWETFSGSVLPNTQIVLRAGVVDRVTAVGTVCPLLDASGSANFWVVMTVPEYKQMIDAAAVVVKLTELQEQAVLAAGMAGMLAGFMFGYRVVQGGGSQ